MMRSRWSIVEALQSVDSSHKRFGGHCSTRTTKGRTKINLQARFTLGIQHIQAELLSAKPGYFRDCEILLPEVLILNLPKEHTATSYV